MYVNAGGADLTPRRSKSTMPCSLLVNLQSERLQKCSMPSAATIGRCAAVRTEARYHFEFAGRSIPVSPALLQTGGGQGRPGYDVAAENLLRGTVPMLTQFMLELSDQVMEYELHRRSGHSPMSLSQTGSSSSSSSSVDRCQWFFLHAATEHDNALRRVGSSEEMLSPRSEAGCLPTRGRYGIWSLERIDLCPERRGLPAAQSQRRHRRRVAPARRAPTPTVVVEWDPLRADCEPSAVKPPSPPLPALRLDAELAALEPSADARARFANDVAPLLGRDGEFTIESPEAVLTCRLRLRQQGDAYVVHLTGIALTVLADNELCLTLAACANAAFCEAAREASTSPERPHSSLSSSARRLRTFVTNALRRRSTDDENN